MARLFISHACADTDLALLVKEWLTGAGHGVFVDCDGLTVGDAWRLRLHHEIRQADGVVCLVTSAFNASAWCAAEVGIAEAFGKRLFPVRCELGAKHDVISDDVQYADMTRGPDRARTELLRALEHTGSDQRSRFRRVLGGLRAG